MRSSLFYYCCFDSNAKNHFMNSIYKATESFDIFYLSNVKRIQVMYENFKFLSWKIKLLGFFEIEYYSFLEFIACISIFHILKLLFKKKFFFNGGHFGIPGLISTVADICWSLYYGGGTTSAIIFAPLDKFTSRARTGFELGTSAWQVPPLPTPMPDVRFMKC